MLKEFDSIKTISEKYEKSYIFSYIKFDEKILEAEKNKHLRLSQKCDYLKNLLENKNDLSSLKQDFKIISFSVFNKYQYEGLVFLEKLITIINSIMSMNENMNLFDLEEINIYIPHEILKQILRTKKEYFHESNQYLIKEYTLKLIKLYEFFYEFIIKKNEESKIKYKNKYNKLKEEVQIERKIYNSNIIKKMLNKRREADAKKLRDKWNKKTVLETRKSDLFTKPNFKKNLSVDNLKKKIEKVDEEEDEYNLLVEDEY